MTPSLGGEEEPREQDEAREGQRRTRSPLGGSGQGPGLVEQAARLWNEGLGV